MATARRKARCACGQPSITTGDSGRSIEFKFCPGCGSTVFWMPEFREDLVAVALGCFEEPSSMVPEQSVYERHSTPDSWTAAGGNADPER